MEIDILTLFPGMFTGPITESIIKRAQEKDLVTISLVNIRDFANNKHNTVDDYPYGGGAGMVMQAGPIFDAVNSIKKTQSKVILMCPQGDVFTQKSAWKLSREEHLIIICGHYEGVDQRVKDELVDQEISIGDFILTGGELPAMIILDSVIRLIPGVLGQDKSVEEESFAQGLLEYPHYTRPADFRGLMVPEILLSGNHESIRKWRKKESIRNTWSKRPELLEKAALDVEGKEMLNDLRKENEHGQT
ncbi:MAG: tRNA (guanosine(37)-N1)-methyltransferase TrmD [Clostridia bacterium]|nr:tRNA (guanosine(37)-N1)-methyltransferase TrmD [Clostridia bacterium]